MKQFTGFIKGVNLGGWLSQYPEYSEKHFNTFIQKADIQKIVKMGFDHIRIPVDYNVLETETAEVIESGYAHLYDALTLCKKYNLKMIIDIHEVFGYSFDPLKDMDREKFFYDEMLQERFFKLWENIATRFGNESDIIAFELLNEVVLQKVYKAWNEVAYKAIQRIRAIAPNTYIIIGGVNYNNVTSVPLLDAPYDDKIVYNFHCYEPFIFTHQKAYWVAGMPSDYEIGYPAPLELYREESKPYQPESTGAIYKENITSIGPEFFEVLFEDALLTAEKYDVPLYCGEYGVIELAPKEDTKRWLADIHSVFDKYGIGRAIWNYKNKDFGIVDSDYGF